MQFFLQQMSQDFYCESKEIKTQQEPTKERHIWIQVFPPSHQQI